MPSDQEQFEIPVKDAKSGAIKSVIFSSPYTVGGVNRNVSPPPERGEIKRGDPALPEIVPEERVAVVRATPLLPRLNPKPVARPASSPTPKPASRPAPRPTPSTPVAEEKSLPTRPEDQAHRAQTNDIYATMAEDVVRNAGVSVTQELAGRLQTIVVSRLKEVRDPIETAEILVRPVSQAGMGFSSVDAKKVLDRADAKFKSLQGELAEVVKEKNAAAIKSETDRAKERKRAAEATEEQAREALFESVTSGTARPVPARPVDLATTATPARPKVQDVARVPGLVGPVEELAALTLADWRKLSQNPKEAALKVRDIIKLLGEQSLERRAAGVHGWKQSEPVRLYEALIGESFRTKKSVRDVIDMRTSEKQPTLTVDEFNAIMELNALLRS